jgi:hypothetical protein
MKNWSQACEIWQSIYGITAYEQYFISKKITVVATVGISGAVFDQINVDILST